ncbi:histidine phosphatase family protein [Rhodoferax saidenbachensis]|uniref:Phosphoglycerate kinase n=1 Tax=Rhodoferax saidenbachensis TaxID=1484693 RepID=A0A1P8K9L6_9BURK|nr:histidine phosphatase family protein [Rhodoferax saidenbachensis]APW42699.1 phosphoglycerate kinase [Rhodoferax saidenbachensis]
MTLWLVRHARPLVDPGVCYGALDVAADAAETQQAAQALAAVLPQGLTVHHSTLQRCEQLAQSLCGLRPDLIPKPDTRLVEMDFGEWEGVPWDHIPRAAVDAWTADFGDHRFGGVESANAVLQRVASAWQDTWNQMGEGDAVWITHAGVIRAAMLISQGVPAVQVPSQWPRLAVDWGQWCCLAPTRPGTAPD